MITIASDPETVCPENNSHNTKRIVAEENNCYENKTNKKWHPN
jgi:hypothetical protein